jgi:broad specificity phosphatase PhoE
VKSLVVLRHSLTRKDRRAADTGSHLSSEGVRLARALGDRLPAFAHVAVGDQPRHLETALALGCAVDEQVAWPSGYVPGVVEHHDQWSWSEPFGRYAQLVSDSEALRSVVEIHLTHWRRMLGDVDDDGSVLVVSSGGSIEPVLVAALPGADHAAWGGAFQQLEGAELTWDGAGFDSVRLIRRDRGPESA